MSNTDPTAVNSSTREELAVPASYKCVLLLYTVKSGKSPGSDGGKKTSTSKAKDPLSFDIWISKHFKDIWDGKGVFVIYDYEHLQIPDNLRRSKRHVI